METKMISAKTLIVVTALLASGSSLVLAQTPPAAGPTPPAGVVNTPGGPAYTGGPTTGRSTAPAARHHSKMYMSTKSPRHKMLKTGQPQPKQPQ